MRPEGEVQSVEQYLTDRAKKGRWWDIPVLAGSGLLTAATISVIFDRFQTMPEDVFIEILACVTTLGLVSAPIWAYLRRRSLQKKARAIAKCLAESGQSSMTFGALQRRTGIGNVEGVLKKLISKGFLQNVTLDGGHGMIRMFGVPEAKVPAEPAPILDTGSADYNATLRQIRDLNDRIDDRVVSERIDRIEALTGGIFKLITERPEKAAEARRFISYYLPTTMKLLESYDLLEDQRFQGETIRESRKKIEAVLDTLIAAIERQHDRLFRADALDVETEIEVLQTMLTADGLTGPERGLRL